MVPSTPVKPLGLGSLMNDPVPSSLRLLGFKESLNSSAFVRIHLDLYKLSYPVEVMSLNLN